jgi:hypothetical protein
MALSHGSIGQHLNSQGRDSQQSSADGSSGSGQQQQQQRDGLRAPQWSSSRSSDGSGSSGGGDDAAAAICAIAAAAGATGSLSCVTKATKGARFALPSDDDSEAPGTASVGSSRSSSSSSPVPAVGVKVNGSAVSRNVGAMAAAAAGGARGTTVCVAKIGRPAPTQAEEVRQILALRHGRSVVQHRRVGLALGRQCCAVQVNNDAPVPSLPLSQ